MWAKIGTERAQFGNVDAELYMKIVKQRTLRLGIIIVFV